MAAFEGDPRISRAGARGTRGTHATRAALVAATLALLATLGADRWYAARTLARARADVRVAGATRAEALRSAMTREVGLLLALVSFTESRSSRAELDAEFRTFAHGVYSEQSLRALQLVDHGRIVLTWPVEGNEAAVGYDLTRHPDARVRAGFERARASGVITITGPIPLLQGGAGLLVRQRIAAPPGLPDLAAVILDVPRLVSAAGIPDRASGLRFELRDRDGAWFAGDPEGSAADPEVIDLVTADGTFTLRVAPAGGWESLTGPPQRMWRGGLALLVLLATLIGWLVGRRRDRLEEDVARSSTALRLVMRESRMGGWEEDLKTGEVRWNATIDLVIGRSGEQGASRLEELLESVDPLDRERLRATLARARAGHSEEFVEEVRIGASTGGRWMLLVGSVIRGDDGRPARLTCVVADAGEQRALEERLRHAQRLESIAKLAGGVARDFDDVLTAIVRSANAARDGSHALAAQDAASVRDDLDQVIATAQRGRRLTEQLSSFSRGTRAAAPAIDVDAAIAELLPTLERLVAGKATLVHERPSVPLRVELDPGQLGQVLVNLVVNARDAMPEGGRIRLRVQLLTDDVRQRPADAPRGRWVLVEVEDEGTGIPDAVRERIFEPYFTTKPEGRGTGLGLSVVFGIVEAAGGSITVSSLEGVGSTFHLFLPSAEGGGA